MQTRRHFLATLPLLALAGCGFRLRGVHLIPFASVWVEADKGSQVAAVLREQIENQQRAALTAAKAERVIVLSREVPEKNILSLSGSGKVAEYRLRLSVTVEIRDSAGNIKAGPVALQTQRDFTFDEAQILAKQHEEALLTRDMAQELTRQIVMLTTKK